MWRHTEEIHLVTYERREALAQEWNEANPRTPEAVDAFYRTTERLMDDLDEWHTEPSRQEWTEAIARVLGPVRPFPGVIDIGAGRGHDLDALAAAGIPMSHLLAVEPNDVARTSLIDRGYLAFSSIDAMDGGSTVDVAICIDVLEHLVEPEVMVDQIAAMLPIGGILFEATATHDILTPMHLKSNWGWLPNPQLIGLGFHLEATVGRLNVWKRTAMHQDAPAQSMLINIYRDIAPEVNDCILSTVLSSTPEFTWQYRQNNKDGLISRARSCVVSDWYRHTNDDVFLMLDDDILFEPWQARRLVELCRWDKRYPIIAAAYVKADLKAPALEFLPGTTVTFGPGQEPQEIRSAATGFMAVRREVIEALIETMPLCDPAEWNFWPMFMPYVVDHEYLSEDYAFCERARKLGFKIFVDPSIRIEHLKPRRLSLDDVAKEYGAESWEGFGFRRGEKPDILKMGEWHG